MPSPVRVEQLPGAPPGLVDDAGPLRFALGNAYYLLEEAARGRLDRVEETFTKLRALGVRVVRTWAFHDDPAYLPGLDHVLERARAHGLYLILPLANYWDAYGGCRQWCRAHGHADAVEGDGRFFVDARVVGAFHAHVAGLLERVNPRTGVRYGDDSAVLCWELMNEPRASCGEDALVDWARATARRVRAHARQLIAMGDEGHEPAFSRLCALPELDLASAHFYPEKYGAPVGGELAFGLEWMRRCAAVAHAAGKPLYVGELGLGNEGAPFARLPLAERRAIYRRWFEEATVLGVAGIGPWMFAYDERPDRWDDFTWYLKDGLPLDAPQNRYADLVAELASALRG